MSGRQVFPGVWRTRALSVLSGAGSVLLPWLILVPWDFSSSESSSRITVGISISVLVAAVVGGAVAFADRGAGQGVVGAAWLTTLVLFALGGIVAGDALWVVGLLLVGLLSLGVLVTAFAVGRMLRTGSSVD